ncbi:MAG TPA: UPF0149 family protein, partial [Verrucomicrobiota bacterium]|nr:UPF0149 family protein [Verrucomicrobiota bacterium]
DFEPLLPDDTVALDARVTALAEWTQGFLFGDVEAGAVWSAAPAAVREVIADFAEIARLRGGGLEDEDDEGGGHVNQNTKHQTPSSRETPSIKLQITPVTRAALMFGAWSFSGVWSFKLGVFISGLRFRALVMEIELERCLSNFVVVVIVRSDPEPHDSTALLTSDSAVFLIDANGPQSTPKFLELERWMKRMLLPQLESFARKLLNLRGQCVEMRPKSRVGV